jgi:hypothetical protein
LPITLDGEHLNLTGISAKVARSDKFCSHLSILLLNQQLPDELLGHLNSITDYQYLL